MIALIIAGSAIAVAVAVAFAVYSSRSGEGKRRRERAGGEGGREREREPEGGMREDAMAAALMQSGLAEAVGRLGFVSGRPGHFTRGALEVTAVVTPVAKGSGVATLHSVDVRLMTSPLALETDFVARAKRGRDGELHVTAQIEAHEGNDTIRREASPTARERFAHAVTAHLPQLDALSFTSVEVFNHRAPRIHVVLRPAGPGALAEQVEGAVREAEELAAKLRTA